MLFPAVIHSDDGIHYGIFLPDIPGVFSGGHSPEECLANVQEAVEMVCTARELTALPTPSRLTDVMASEAAADGWVMPVAIARCISASPSLKTFWNALTNAPAPPGSPDRPI